MSESCILPDFSMDDATRVARDCFGLQGTLSPLAGERDLNFLVQGEEGKFVLKIASAREDPAMLQCQGEVLERIARAGIFPRVSRPRPGRSGAAIETISDGAGNTHQVRVVDYVEGRLLSAVHPHTGSMLEDLGSKLAQLDRALQGYRHDALDRPLLWEMHRGDRVVERFLPMLESDDRRQLIGYFLQLFRSEVLPRARELRFDTIHNDANDNNVLVAGDDPWSLRIASIIDFGDMLRSWVVADPAIAAAYAMLGKEKPLDAAAPIVRGYHRTCPLDETEIRVLYPLMCMRLCMSVCISAHQQSQDPDNAYLAISEQPAWEMLQRLRAFSPDYVHYLFRSQCGLEPVPGTIAVMDWLQANRESFFPVMGMDLSQAKLMVIDSSVDSPHLETPGLPMDPDAMARDITRGLEDGKCEAGIGRYAEYRLIYDSDDFVDVTGHRRTLHLGIDVFMAAGSTVHAPLDGRVHSVADNNTPLDYGGTLILRHETGDGDSFYTLYGHLAPASLQSLVPGQQVSRGEAVAALGAISENGHWPPHLHFQVVTDLLDQDGTFYGVGTHAHRDVWLSLCPDPNVVLGVPASLLVDEAMDGQQILHSRRQSLNPSLSLSYREPIHMVRGGFQYLYDAAGRRYLDAVNNVPHVGHCHPRVVAAQARQAKLLNTNTRYLYDTLAAYSEKLLSYFPEPLTVCYFTCSGSEANDLALRLARNYTGRHDAVILDHAYHGNLGTLIEVSPYKHDSAGGSGTPVHVHKTAIPDTYRGLYRADDPQAANRYAGEVGKSLVAAEESGGAAVFLTESVLGCGGQVILPDGYLQQAYAHARGAGALCIADEVQVGFGRVGSHFWAFETQDVVPDIVTLGKPIGNGHPMAAVITTRAIADAFDNGMEYFNTFGGNPVSCAIGSAVLEVIEGEGLQQNALETGSHLLSRFEALQQEFAIIGDARGLGLFLGLELVDDRGTLDPAADQASYIAERMKEEGILISTDGPYHNVLKIKPPLCFNRDNADRLADTLARILHENFARPCPVQSTSPASVGG